MGSNASSGFKSSTGSDMWSSMGSGLGLIGSGLDAFSSLFGSGSGSAGDGVDYAAALRADMYV